MFVVVNQSKGTFKKRKSKIPQVIRKYYEPKMEDGMTLTFVSLVQQWKINLKKKKKNNNNTHSFRNLQKNTPKIKQRDGLSLYIHVRHSNKGRKRKKMILFSLFF